MGADLIGTILVIDENKKPDWTAAKKFVAEFSDLELLDDSDSGRVDVWETTGGEEYAPNIETLTDEDKETLAADRREGLTLALATVREAYDEGWRTTQVFNVRGATIWFLGETTWGDSPDGINEIGLLHVMGVLKKAGFDE